MKILKVFHFREFDRGDPLKILHHPIQIIERLDSDEYSIFTWPSSLLLALYLISVAKEIKGRTILELGAGTALPSIVSGSLLAEKVFISDRAQEVDILDNIREIIQLNNLESVLQVLPFDWGNAFPHPEVDIILGADVFYSSEDFDKILFTVYSIFALNPNAVFFTSYQMRR
jgi:predicted nicotinamide N-methyase